MHTCRFTWLSMSLLVYGLALPGALAAQSSVAAVKTGTITVTNGVSRPVVALTEGVLDVRAAFDDGAFEADQCSPCIAGALVGVDGRITATGKGTQFYEADFAISGAALEVPRNGYADLVLTGPFSFQGRMIVSPRRDSGANEKDPALTLEGGGTVTVKLTSSLDPDTGERLYFFQDATYQFSPTAR